MARTLKFPLVMNPITFVAMSAALLFACTSGDGTSSNASDTTPVTSYCRTDGTTRSESPPDGGATCTTLTQVGACYPVVSTKAIPAATGGTIVDGLYVLTSVRSLDTTKDEGTPMFTNAPTTLRCENGVVERLVDPGIAVGPAAGFKGTYTNENPTTLSVAATCPASLALKWPYTADATTLVLTDAPGIESTYTKQ